MTTDAGCHRPSAARLTTSAVRSVGAAYYSMRQLAHRLLQPLDTTVGDILILYIMLESPFSLFTCLYFSLDTVLSHNYCVIPVIKVISDFQSCLLFISSFHSSLQLSEPIGEKVTRQHNTHHERPGWQSTWK